MSLKGNTGIRRIARQDVSGREGREERREEPRLAAVPTGLLLVVHGRETGERYELHAGPLVIGHGDSCDLVLSEPGIGEAHARLLYEHGQWVVVDLGEVAGTFVNDERVTEYVLRDGDRLRMGRTILKLLTAGDIERRAVDELFRVEKLDGLTQAANNATFHEALERDVAHARRHHLPLSLVAFDVDGFRALNAARGEAIGNQVLQRLTLRLRSLLRKQDSLARIGDDEFAVLLPATALADAVHVGEKLRAAVEGEPLRIGSLALSVTVSGGVTTLSGSEPGGALVERGNAGVAASQRAGGNRLVTMAPTTIELPTTPVGHVSAPLDDDDD